MSTSLNALIPDLQPFARDLLRVAGAAGLQPRITSTRRTYDEQERLYRRFLAGESQYPVAPPGTSAHEFGYAFDMMIAGPDMDQNLNDLGTVWTGWGGVWGGVFQDPIHFEFPGFPHDQVALAADAAAKAAPSGTPWYKWHPPKLAEDVLNLIPGVQLISDLVDYLGIH
jgi:D-alanyl-D-alanine carboxypeptidase